MTVKRSQVSQKVAHRIDSIREGKHLIQRRKFLKISHWNAVVPCYLASDKRNLMCCQMHLHSAVDWKHLPFPKVANLTRISIFHPHTRLKETNRDTISGTQARSPLTRNPQEYVPPRAIMLLWIANSKNRRPCLPIVELLLHSKGTLSHRSSSLQRWRIPYQIIKMADWPSDGKHVPLHSNIRRFLITTINATHFPWSTLSQATLR